MEDMVYRSDSWSGDRLVPELDRIRDGLGFYVLGYDTITAVVFEAYVDAPSFLSSKVP